MNAQGNSVMDKVQRIQRTRRDGQTLVMAMIILGVLLILGVVFVALVSRNIRQATQHHERTRAYDLAEAGIRHVHAQMLHSPLGADWRPTPSGAVPRSDPDYEYLRLPDPSDPTDHGGPDKQGPYSRLLFDKGRTLVRVSYAPSNPTVFSAFAVGDLVSPGMARSYTIIESVGKARTLNLNDPTSTSMQSGQSRELTESSKIVGFVSVATLEYARMIQNKEHISSPAEFGYDKDVSGNVYYGDNGNGPELVDVPVVLGNVGPLFNLYDPRTNAGTTATAGQLPYGGSFWSNADLLLYGDVRTNLNAVLGDSFNVVGTIRGANDNASLTINGVTRDTGSPPQWTSIGGTLANGTNPSLSSMSPNYSTVGGLLKDGVMAGDQQGFPRGIGWKEPASILGTDPETGVNRYLQMTQLSGHIYVNSAGFPRNAGYFGHGQGVYVDNSEDIQVPADAEGRQDVGSAESLPYDWLNPNNGMANSGWQGSFYVPLGAYVKLLNDGFIIVRDGRAPQNKRTWRMPDGSIGKRTGAFMNSNNPADQVDSPYIRYKLVYDASTDQTYIFNNYSVMPNGMVVDLDNINSASIGNWRAAGYPFNGVLYFAGNVRVRGQIPTDMQMTIVSNATIYIEGSITKGVINNGTRTTPQIGRPITTPSRSMLALMAKDYVTINTTQFFGSPPEQTLEEVKENPAPVEWNAVRVRTGGNIGLLTEFTLDPQSNFSNPSARTPFASEYNPAGSPGVLQPQQLLLTHTMDDGPAPASFINLDVNYQVGMPYGSGEGGEWQYLFDLGQYNGASTSYPVGYVPPHYSVADRAPLYGLGMQPWQRYPKFESSAFPLVSTDFNYDPLGLTLQGSNTTVTGKYYLLIENSNDFTIGLRDTVGGNPTNNYVLARAAIVPHDIRIEAAIFAEEGSFFVIPGPWFNPDINDRRDTYMTLGADDTERAIRRLERFGAMPNMPFYGEPLDVKVSILGSITENMPPPIAQQGEWLRKWGWIPRYHGATTDLIPDQHVPNGYNVNTTDSYVPNLTVTFDPALATDRNVGFVGASDPNVDRQTLIRRVGVDVDGDDVKDIYYALPPIPRLPVSPTLAYFGEVNP